MSMHKTVRTRLAPSPTGELHVGGLAMALKGYAWAKKNDGTFILRIEDTDQTREVTGAVDRIKQILMTFNLQWDEGPDVGGDFGPYIQSERLPLYQKYAQELLANGHAYYCFCTKERLAQVRDEQRAKKLPPMYDGHCRSLSESEVQAKLDNHEPSVIRLKVPKDESLSFTDLLRGTITFETNTVDDQVLLKSDGFPTYHLAVVVDDHTMHISHVFRGEEWISSAPKHVLLYRSFGWELPVFVHFPIFLNPTGKGKMSKRHGTVSVESFLSQGYLPDALLNFLMILGWAPKDDQEVMSLERYINEFNPGDVSSKSVKFDLTKLQWLNGVYIRTLSMDALSERLQPFLPTDFPQDRLVEILPLVSERLVLLSDIEELTNFFYRPIEVDPQQLLKKADAQLVKEQLQQTHAALAEHDSWELAAIETTIRELQERHDWHRGQYFMMLRLAVTGKKATPPLFETISALGTDQTLERLDSAGKML